MISEFDKLRPGDLIRVRFGRAASQLAVVAKRTPRGNLHAYKLSAKRRTWKGPIRIEPAEFMQRAGSSELRGFPVPPIAWRPS